MKIRIAIEILLLGLMILLLVVLWDGINIKVDYDHTKIQEIENDNEEIKKKLDDINAYISNLEKYGIKVYEVTE